MTQKAKHQAIDDEEFYNLKEEDVGEEVKFQIDKDAFKAPFTFRYQSFNKDLGSYFCFIR